MISWYRKDPHHARQIILLVLLVGYIGFSFFRAVTR